MLVLLTYVVPQIVTVFQRSGGVYFAAHCGNECLGALNLWVKN